MKYITILLILLFLLIPKSVTGVFDWDTATDEERKTKYYELKDKAIQLAKDNIDKAEIIAEYEDTYAQMKESIEQLVTWIEETKSTFDQVTDVLQQYIESNDKKTQTISDLLIVISQRTERLSETIEYAKVLEQNLDKYKKSKVESLKYDGKLLSFTFADRAVKYESRYWGNFIEFQPRLTLLYPLQLTLDVDFSVRIFNPLRIGFIGRIGATGSDPNLLDKFYIAGGAYIGLRF